MTELALVSESVDVDVSTLVMTPVRTLEAQEVAMAQALKASRKMTTSLRRSLRTMKRQRREFAALAKQTEALARVLGR